MSATTISEGDLVVRACCRSPVAVATRTGSFDETFPWPVGDLDLVDDGTGLDGVRGWCPVCEPDDQPVRTGRDPRVGCLLLRLDGTTSPVWATDHDLVPWDGLDSWRLSVIGRRLGTTMAEAADRASRAWSFGGPRVLGRG